jgi:hypothetical protein
VRVDLEAVRALHEAVRPLVEEGRLEPRLTLGDLLRAGALVQVAAVEPIGEEELALAERLIGEGRMHASGLAEVDRAKADGRWQAAYAGPATARVPDDLAAALAADAKAKTMFGRLTSQNRYAILHRIEAVKRPETRARKIAEFVAMLARGETVHPQTRRNHHDQR